MIKLEILNHDGSVETTEVETYNPVEMAKELNDWSKNNVMVIGDVIVHKTSVKKVRKV